MEFLMDGIRWLHVVAGFTGLAAFWVPIFAHKGGVNHRKFGKVFKYCAYVVLFGALASVTLHLADGLARGVGPSEKPAAYGFLFFLGYLALVTFIGMRHGLQVLENKPDLSAMNSPLNRAMAWLAIASSLALIAYTVYFSPPNQIILFVLSPIGFATGSGILKAIRGRRPEGKAWFYEHMGAMIGTGVAFHTAFAVFGSLRIFDLGLEGWVAVLPWITPALIGIPAILIWTRHYQRKFNDLPAKGATGLLHNGPSV